MVSAALHVLVDLRYIVAISMHQIFEILPYGFDVLLSDSMIDHYLTR